MPSAFPNFTLADAATFVRTRSFGADPDTENDVCDRRGIGIELEFLTDTPGRQRLTLDQAQAVIDEVTPLPAGGKVTVEPGGQLELSTLPFATLDEACTGAGTDLLVLDQACERRGIGLYALGADPVRLPQRVVSAPRYRAMEAYFDAAGPAGRAMMHNTAAVQVNVGLGDGHETSRRWHLANAISPTLIACFANSPFAAGEPSAWQSTRLRAWWELDPTRSAPVPVSDDPVLSWLHYALDAHVMFIRERDDRFSTVATPMTFHQWIEQGHELGWPTVDDFSYHLTTLFPPVRPKGWFELRAIDALPTPFWHVAAAVAYALLNDEAAGPEVTAAVQGTTGLWVDAARIGLAHPLLARSGRRLFALATESLVALGVGSATIDVVGAYCQRWTDRARCPADDLVAAWHRDGSLFPVRESPVPYAFDALDLTELPPRAPSHSAPLAQAGLDHKP